MGGEGRSVQNIATIPYKIFKKRFFFLSLASASAWAAAGMLIFGKAYIAPCTSLQWTPGTALKPSVTSLAFLRRALRTDPRSCEQCGHINIGTGYITSVCVCVCGGGGGGAT